MRNDTQRLELAVKIASQPRKALIDTIADLLQRIDHERIQVREWRCIAEDLSKQLPEPAMPTHMLLPEGADND